VFPEAIAAEASPIWVAVKQEVTALNGHPSNIFNRKLKYLIHAEQSTNKRSSKREI
jgi:hypothetical protein